MYLSGLGAVDQLVAVWEAIRPEAINAHVGSDGWWYDNTDNHRLSHEEAAYKQQGVIASMIGAAVDKASGWWTDLFDGHQLSHDEAWHRYQSVQNGTPWAAPAMPLATPTTPFSPTPPSTLPMLPAVLFGPVDTLPQTPPTTLTVPHAPASPLNLPPIGVPTTSGGLFGLSTTTLALGGAAVLAAVLLLGKRGSAAT